MFRVTGLELSMNISHQSYIQFTTISYSHRAFIPIIEPKQTVDDWIKILKTHNLLDCFDPTLAFSSGENIFKECVQKGLTKVFDGGADGKSYLQYKFLDEMLATIPTLSSASKKTRNYSIWRNSACTNSCLSFINWIYTLPSTAVNKDSKAFATARKVCNDIDKRWTVWFQSVSFETKPDNFVDWAYFLETGEVTAPEKKRKTKGSTRSSKKTKR